MKRHIAFLTSILLIFMILFVGIFIRGIKDISVVENKKLAKFPVFTLNTFFNHSFQDTLEEAISDQLILGEALKDKYLTLKKMSMGLMVDSLTTEVVDTTNNTNETDSSISNASTESTTQEIEMTTEPPAFEASVQAGDEILDFVPRVEKIESYEKPYMSLLKWQSIDDTNFKIELVPKGEGLVEAVDEKHLIFNSVPLAIAKEGLSTKAKTINELAVNYPEVQFYNFYIESDVDLDFINGKITHDLSNYLSEQFESPARFKAFTIDSLETYINGFYRTDHHWDTERQLEGYRSLILFIKGENEPLLDFDLYLTNLKYNGYKSRLLNEFTTADRFKFIVPKTEKYTVYINGYKGYYGQKYEFINGQFTQKVAENYYGDCNGADFGLVEFDFNQPEKENAVFFIDSFSNPLKDAIASHFNKTYFVDFRYYEQAMGKPFDFGDFVNENDINVAVNMGYYYFFVGDTFNIQD
ncbi:MAG: hypothetical protein BGO41_14530 [Clostridiales bacterium 38-18]|nr:MAG: hypothetical protein BGO41_14530 [Clostridiales bacterium 38-18]